MHCNVMIVFSLKVIENRADFYRADSVEQFCYPGDALLTLHMQVVKEYKTYELQELSTGDIYLGRTMTNDFLEFVMCLPDAPESMALIALILQNPGIMEDMLMEAD